MRKYIICFLLFFCCIGSMNSQSVSAQIFDYQGTWQGQDAAGNLYKFVLHADYTGELLINGTSSTATLFKIDVENSVNTLGHGTVDLYAPNSVTNNNGTALSQNNNPWQLLQCGIIAFDGNELLLQLDKGIDRPLQFDTAIQATLIK